MNFKSTIQWATPYSLGLLLALAVVAAVGFVLLRWASGRPIAPARRVGLLAIRLAILAILGLIIINPVRVDETPGAIELPKLFYLLDTSQSMAIGKGANPLGPGCGHDPRRRAGLATRVPVPRSACSGSEAAWPPWTPEFWRPAGAEPAPGASPARCWPPSLRGPREQPPAPTDSDTLLGASLEGLTDRFGQAPPQAVVVFSDGRTRDPDRAETIARAYGRMKVPVHVFPVGDENVGGDVAIVSMVAPDQVRKYSKVSAQVFVRCFGYKGKRSELKIVAVGPDGKPDAVLARTPVVLQEGLTSYPLAFESGDQDRRIEARIDPQPGEVSVANNAFGADLAIDHTKIRVLYLEGANERFVAAARPSRARRRRGPRGLLIPSGGADGGPGCRVHGRRAPAGRQATSRRWRTDEHCELPETPSQFFAYDAIILSNVPRDVLSDQHLAWIEEWIGRRGGGLCMVGGPNSFASGRWNETSVGQMLPVRARPRRPRLGRGARRVIHVTAKGAGHPIWHLSSDEAQNRSVLKALPSFLGSNRFGRVKPGADVLAQTTSSGAARRTPARDRGPTLRPGPHDGHDHRPSPAAGRASSPSRGAGPTLAITRSSGAMSFTG